MSEKTYRDKIATIQKQQADQESIRTTALAAAAKRRGSASKEFAKITSRTTESSARMYRSNADRETCQAETEDKKAVGAQQKLAQLSKDLGGAHDNLEREIRQEKQGPSYSVTRGFRRSGSR